MLDHFALDFDGCFRDRPSKATTDSPVGLAAKNLPANAGDTSSIPGLGISHIPQSN